MPSAVGIIADSYNPPAVTCTDVITLEPFNNFTDNSWTLTNTPTIVAGRTGTAANFFSTSQRADYNIAAPSQSDTVTFGFAWRHTDASTVNRNICQLYSDDGATQHNLLQWNKATGLLIFTRGGATIGSTTFAGVQNTWYYIEIQAKLHDSTGFGIVRIDGAEVINTGAVDTKGGGTKTVYDQLRILAGVTSLTNQYDDLYLRTGSACTFRGDFNWSPSAVAFKTAVGSAVSVVSATTLVITTTAGIAVGDLVVVRVAADNLSTGSPTFTCADSAGNTYISHAFRAVVASAAAGVAGGILATKATAAVAAGGTITVTLSGAVFAKAAYAESFTGVNNTVRSTAVTNIGLVAAGTAVTVTSGAANTGDLVVASGHAETMTPPSAADTDTVGGTWSTMVSLPAATTGTDNQRVIVSGQYKIVTAAGTQTWDITNGIAADWTAAIVALQAA